MANLYADEQFPLPVVKLLRDFGHNILTVQEAGKTGDSDEEVFAFSIKCKRAILTHNRRHFIKLHLENPNHYGIIICTDDRDSNGLAQRINREVIQEKSLENKLIRIKRPQT